MNKTRNHLVAARLPAIVSALLVAGISGCHSWQRNQTVDGIEYTKVRFIPKNKADAKGTFLIGLLKRPTLIGDLNYSGWLHLRSNATVAGGLLHQGAKVNGMTIPAGTWVAFGKDGKLSRCHFPADRLVQGHACIGTGGGVKGATVTFYPSGRLKYFFPVEDVVIHGIPCKGGTRNVVGLHENGALMTCTASKDTRHNDVVIQKGVRVEFDKDGGLTRPGK